MGKPTIVIEPDVPARASLPLQTALRTLHQSKCFYLKRRQRHPLGIYNLSVSRIIADVKSCCAKIEIVTRNIKDLDAAQKEKGDLNDLLVSLERLIYSVGEHADDLSLILKSFFEKDIEFNRNKAAKKFRDDLKPLRDFTSALVNTIKHANGRVRMFSMAALVNNENLCLHGFCIEGSDGETAGPIAIEGSGVKLFSITAFVWRVFMYILDAGERLFTTLKDLDVIDFAGFCPESSRELIDASYCLLRLPQYVFEDLHPFDKTTFQFNNMAALDTSNSLLGSSGRPWPEPMTFTMIGMVYSFNGDGVTKRFDVPQPKTVRLVHLKPQT